MYKMEQQGSVMDFFNQIPCFSQQLGMEHLSTPSSAATNIMKDFSHFSNKVLFLLMSGKSFKVLQIQHRDWGGASSLRPPRFSTRTLQRSQHTMFIFLLPPSATCLHALQCTFFTPLCNSYTFCLTHIAQYYTYLIILQGLKSHGSHQET